jgi:hypothetical protein
MLMLRLLLALFLLHSLLKRSRAFLFELPFCLIGLIRLQTDSFSHFAFLALKLLLFMLMLHLLLRIIVPLIPISPNFPPPYRFHLLPPGKIDLLMVFYHRSVDVFCLTLEDTIAELVFAFFKQSTYLES